MNRKNTYSINREQLSAALEGLDAVIEDTQCLVDSLEYEYPREPLSEVEREQLVSEKLRLRNFRARRKELKRMLRAKTRIVA